MSKVPDRLATYATPTGLNLPGGLPYEEWEALVADIRHVYHGAGEIRRRSALWWGDAIVYGEREYGEAFAQALTASDYSEGALRNAVYVAQKVRPALRPEGLGPSYMQEVAPLPESEQRKYLQLAAPGEDGKPKMKRNELRRMIREDQEQREQANVAVVKRVTCPRCQGEGEIVEEV